MKFSDLTLECLKKAGWSETYRADMREYEQLMEKSGCPLPVPVKGFLSRFGKLTIKHPHFRVKSTEDNFHFDAMFAAAAPAGHYCDDLDQYSERVGVHLYAIGEASRGYLLLMMGDNGQVYAAYDQFMIFIAQTGEEAVEALCSGREFKEIA